jgi:hypothetical protein
VDIVVEDHARNVFEILDIPLVVHVATGVEDLSNTRDFLGRSSAEVGQLGSSAGHGWTSGAQ